MIVNEFRLLLGSEFDHGASLVRMAQGGEELPFRPEVGMMMVSALFGVVEAQGQATELVGRHGASGLDFTAGYFNKWNARMVGIALGSRSAAACTTTSNRKLRVRDHRTPKKNPATEVMTME